MLQTKNRYGIQVFANFHLLARYQSHTVAVYRLAAELQTLVPLWISPESKEARGRQLRTAQTEGAHF